MTLPEVLQSKITKYTVTMRKSIRFPTGGSLTRPYIWRIVSVRQTTI